MQRNNREQWQRAASRHVFYVMKKAVGASFYDCLCCSNSLFPSLQLFLVGKALLSVVYTEDIKWPVFTEMLELLLHAEVLLSQRLRGEIRRYQRGVGRQRNVDKLLWRFSVPKQRCHFGTLCEPCLDPFS